MYGVALATFPDPAPVLAAAAFDTFVFGGCFDADGFALDTIDRSEGVDRDILVSALRESNALLFLPLIDIELRPVIALLIAVDWRGR